MAERAGSQTSGAPSREGGVTTFAFDVGNPLSTARPASTGAAVRGGVVAQGPRSVPQIDGRGVNQAAAIAAADMDNLMRFAGAVLGPKIQQEQDAAYWEGVKKAASGQGIKEILDEQPWYSKIFGDTPLVQGARAYTAQKNLTDTLAEIGHNMGELRKLSPDQVTGEFVRRLDGMMTGDPVTDAMLKQSAAEQLPILLKQHTKEHYAYLQSDIRIKQFESWTSVGARMQAAGEALASGTLTPEDFQVLLQNAGGSLLPLDGQTEESYQGNMETFYMSSAQAGHFHMVKYLEDKGFLNQVPPERRKSLEDTRHRYAQRVKADYVSANMAEDLAALNAVARTNPYDTKTMAEMSRAINARFRAATGIDEDVVDVARTVETSAVTLYNARDKVLDKLQQEETKRASAIYGFAAGYGKSSYADLGLSATEADAEFVRLHDSSKDPLNLLIKNAVAPTPYVSPEIKGRIQGLVSAGLGQPYAESGIGALYQQWKSLNDIPTGGRATAAAYFGDSHAQFTRMDALIRSGRPPEIAYHQAFVSPPSMDARVSKDNAKLLSAAVDRMEGRDGVFGWFKSIFGTNLSEGARRQVETYIGPKFDEYMQLNPGHTPEAAADDLVRRAWANGELEVYGEYAWPKAPTQTSFRTYAEAHVPELLNKSMAEVIRKQARLSGVTLDDESTTFMHLNDDMGVPQVVILSTAGGEVSTLRINGDQVKEEYKKLLLRLKGTEGSSTRPAPIVPDYRRPGSPNVGWGGQVFTQ